jgi:GNAT superfamily N-acetyltransferase
MRDGGDGDGGDGDGERRSGADERPDRDGGPGAAHVPADVTVGLAREGERATALSIIDMAGLEVAREAVMDGEREVLVAVTDGRVLGALVLEGERIEAVAVRPGRQGQGIGSGLVAAANARCERLIAEFDAKVRDFYENLGFETETLGESRYRGVLE